MKIGAERTTRDVRKDNSYPVEDVEGRRDNILACHRADIVGVFSNIQLPRSFVTLVSFSGQTKKGLSVYCLFSNSTFIIRLLFLRWGMAGSYYSMKWCFMSNGIIDFNFATYLLNSVFSFSVLQLRTFTRHQIACGEPVRFGSPDREQT
jgi:hypothetical protein